MEEEANVVNTVTVVFEREALKAFENLFKLGNVRDLFGNKLSLKVDEYKPGKATLTLTVEGTERG